MVRILTKAFLLFSVSSEPMEPGALIVIDMQKCFLDECGSSPKGSIGVTGSHSIVKNIDAFRKWGKASGFLKLVLFTTDTHSPNHISFAENHEDGEGEPREAFGKVNLVCNLGGFGTHQKFATEHPRCCEKKKEHDSNTPLCDCAVDETGNVRDPDQCRVIEQVLWPRHCVPEDGDNVITPYLTPEPEDEIVEKGTEVDVDSYSGLFPFLNLTEEEIRRAAKGSEHASLKLILPTYKHLLERGIKKVYVTGVATDFCVGSTARDLHTLGFNVTVVRDAVMGAFPESNEDAYFERVFKKQGIDVMTTEELASASGSDKKMEKEEIECLKKKDMSSEEVCSRT